MDANHACPTSPAEDLFDMSYEERTAILFAMEESLKSSGSSSPSSSSSRRGRLAVGIASPGTKKPRKTAAVTIDLTENDELEEKDELHLHRDDDDDDPCDLFDDLECERAPVRASEKERKISTPVLVSVDARKRPEREPLGEIVEDGPPKKRRRVEFSGPSVPGAFSTTATSSGPLFEKRFTHLFVSPDVAAASFRCFLFDADSTPFGSALIKRVTESYSALSKSEDGVEIRSHDSFMRRLLDNAFYSKEKKKVRGSTGARADVGLRETLGQPLSGSEFFSTTLQRMLREPRRGLPSQKERDEKGWDVNLAPDGRPWLSKPGEDFGRWKEVNDDRVHSHGPLKVVFFSML